MKKDKSLFAFTLNKRRGVCIVGVTFVKWPVLFWPLDKVRKQHYSNTCYWDDQTTKSWLLLETGVSTLVFTGQEERLPNCNLPTSSKRKWLNMSPHEPMVSNFRRLGHASPIPTLTDVSPQLLVRGVRTCRNKDTSWCVCVCLCRHHCEAQGLALQHVLVSGFPTAVGDWGATAWPSPFVCTVWKGVQKHDGPLIGCVMWCYDWVSCFVILVLLAISSKIKNGDDFMIVKVHNSFGGHLTFF